MKNLIFSISSAVHVDPLSELYQSLDKTFGVSIKIGRVIDYRGSLVTQPREYCDEKNQMPLCLPGYFFPQDFMHIWYSVLQVGPA